MINARKPLLTTLSPALLLASGLIFTPVTAHACHAPHGGHGGPHRPHHPPPPPKCDIPDDRYQLSGVFEQNPKVSMTLWMKQGVPTLVVTDKNTQQQYLATPNKRPHPPGHRPGGPRHEKCHREGRPPHHGHHRHGPRHPGKPPHHFGPKACKDNILTFAWEATSSVPSSLGGKVTLELQSGSLFGTVQLKGKGIEIDDKSVNFTHSGKQ